jgi:hypothetical protein
VISETIRITLFQSFVDWGVTILPEIYMTHLPENYGTKVKTSTVSCITKLLKDVT